MKTVTRTLICLIASMGSLLAEEAADPIGDFFKDGKITVNARLRYEFAEAGGTTIDDGFSARIRYGWVSGKYEGFQVGIEGETLESLGSDADINGLDAAGEGSELNQAWLSYGQKDQFSVKAGRQIYTLLDHRFIGHVGWRQNIQTFDAISASFTGVEGLTVDAFYLDKVNRVNGAYNDMETFGLQAAYKVSPYFVPTVFFYSIEVEGAPGTLGAAASNDSFGIRFTGAATLGDTKLSYWGSYVAQEDNGGSPVAFESDYWALEVKATFDPVTVGAGFELMGDGFRTPLATVHKFAGFADVFAVPSLAGGVTDGLNDYYALVSYKIPVGKGIALTAIYHKFETSGGDSLGKEFDAVAAYSLNKYIKFVAKYANYSADVLAGYGSSDKDLFTFEVNFVY